jgi:hypothetical protein
VQIPDEGVIPESAGDEQVARFFHLLSPVMGGDYQITS